MVNLSKMGISNGRHLRCSKDGEADGQETNTRLAMRS